MLKYFYKTFLIAVLSGSLLSLQTSVAYAAGTNTTDKNGVITNTQKHSFDKIQDSDMLASITMLAGSFIAGRMIQAYTPVTTDVMIAGAAGAAFIAGEILTNLKFKGTIDAMTIEIQKKSDGTINEEQIQRLQDLKKSYEEAKETTETKKTLQLAAAVGFGLAGATALYLSMSEAGMVAACNQSIVYMTPTLQACVKAGATGVVATEAASCGACIEGLQTFQALLTSYAATRKVPAASVIKDKSTAPKELALAKPACVPGGTIVSGVLAKLEATCKPALITMVKNQQDANPRDLIKFVSTDKFINKLINFPVAVEAKPKSPLVAQVSKYLEEAMDLLFSKAEAGWLPMLGLGAGTLTAFLAISGTTAVEIDMLMFVPSNRAIAFGLLAATSYMASKASDNVIEELDKNIGKIDKILADLNRMAAGIKAQNLTQQQIKIQTVKAPNNQQIDFNKDLKMKSECLTNNSTENCKPAENELAKMPGFANLPDSFKDLASQATSLGDKLSGTNGISGSALSSANSLAAKHSAVAKLLKGRQDAYEKLTGVNLQNEQGKLFARLNAGTKKALMKNGMTATGMMASIGGNPISAAGLKELQTPEPSKKLTPTANVVDISSGDEEKKKDNSLDLNFSEETSAPVDMSGGTANSKAPEYQIDSNEINGENGPSIFEVLSNRYIKSGYPKLLEEEPLKN